MNLFKKLFSKKSAEPLETIDIEKEKLTEQIRLARNEMEVLQCEYNFVSDQEAIDSVIYRLQAATSRHSLLMKQYRSIAS